MTAAAVPENLKVRSVAKGKGKFQAALEAKFGKKAAAGVEGSAAEEKTESAAAEKKEDARGKFGKKAKGKK